MDFDCMWSLWNLSVSLVKSKHFSWIRQTMTLRVLAISSFTTTPSIRRTPTICFREQTAFPLLIAEAYCSSHRIGKNCTIWSSSYFFAIMVKTIIGIKRRTAGTTLLVFKITIAIKGFKIYKKGWVNNNIINKNVIIVNAVSWMIGFFIVSNAYS